MNKVSEALILATCSHDGQTRTTTGLPYIVHPVEAMTILVAHGIRDEDALAAAVLHDIVEDTGISLDVIYRRFGDKVWSILNALTKPKGDFEAGWVHTMKALRDQDWEHANTGILVKMADRLSNLRDLPSMQRWKDDRKRRYAEQGLELARLGEERGFGGAGLAGTLKVSAARLLEARA